MIKIVILLIVLLLFVFIYWRKKENFHEKEKKYMNLDLSQIPEVLSSCKSCSYCDFNNSPEYKPYIISRCLAQHTTSSGVFKEQNTNCPPHKALSNKSGCKNGVNFYKQNIKNLKDINSENRSCMAKYDLDDLPSSGNAEKQNYEKKNYETWLESFKK